MAILKISALLGLLAVTSVSSLHAAGYPDRPVKVIVPFPAGGVTDIATRVIVQRLSERLGQQFSSRTSPVPAAISGWETQRTRRATATRCYSPHRASW